MKRALLVLTVLLASTSAYAQNAQVGPAPPGSTPVVLPVERPDAATNTQHSHSTGATITLSAGTVGGPSQSVYITGIDISNCQGASAVTAATPTYITTTGVNGSPQYQVGSGSATAGLCSPTQTIAFTAPLKSASPGTNVTFVMPTFATNQTISVNVYYRLGF